ncbi:MAG: hypothetical protein CMJ18_09025 [Phycisphaeraceae bacterium]|nr:hypothetical protein [Phycisphaeraceae bacterium]
MRPGIAVVAMMTALTSSAVVAEFSQDEPAETEATGTTVGNFTFQVEPRASTTLEASYGPLDLAIIRSGIDFKLKAQVSEQMYVGLGFDFEHSRYDFENLSKVAALTGADIEDAYAYTITPSVVVRHDERLSWFVRGLLTWATTDGTDFSDAFYAGGFAGVRYHLSRDLALTAGAGVIDRFEDSARFIPVLGVSWRISERMALEVQGPRATFQYDLGRNLVLSIFARYQARQYRIQHAPGVGNGVLEDDRLETGLGLSWHPTDRVEGYFEAGIVPWSEIEIDTSAGANVFDDDGGVAAWFGGGLRFTF